MPVNRVRILLVRCVHPLSIQPAGRTGQHHHAEERVEHLGAIAAGWPNLRHEYTERERAQHRHGELELE